MSERSAGSRGDFALRPGRPKIVRAVGGYQSGGTWVGGRLTEQYLDEPDALQEVDMLLAGVTQADLWVGPERVFEQTSRPYRRRQQHGSAGRAELGSVGSTPRDGPTRTCRPAGRPV